MTLPASIESALVDVGFTATEILILKRLLEQDALTLRELALKTGKSTGVLDQATKKLMKKGIIGREEINGTPKFTLGSLQSIVQWMNQDLKAKHEQLKRRNENFESFIASIAVDRARPDMKHFHGEEGIKQAYIELLEQGKELLVYMPVDGKEEEDPLREFRVQFFRMRRQKEIFSRVLAHGTPLGRRYESRDPFEYRKTLLVASDAVPIPFEKIIVGNTVACFDHGKQSACFIQFPELAQAERALFEGIWKGAAISAKAQVDAPQVQDAPAPISQRTQIVSQLREFFLGRQSIIALSFIVLASAVLTFSLYAYNREQAVTRLRERLEAIAATGALQFTAEELGQLREYKDIEKGTYQQVVTKLQHIRNQNEDILYVYLFRPKMGTVFEFIGDADGANPTARTDTNRDGVINDADEVGTPGRQYDVTHIPVLAEHRFTETTSTQEPYEDQWGKVYTGYAPIKDDAGAIQAVLAVDMKADAPVLQVNILIIVGSFLVFLAVFLLLRLWATNRTLFQALAAGLSYKHGIAAGLVLVFMSISIWGGIVYKQSLENERIRQRVLSIATTGALQFDPAVLAKLRTPEDASLPEYAQVIAELNRIRSQNKDVKYAYIMRTTEDPMVLKFVADADSLDLKAKKDLNLDGKIDDMDWLSPPGEEYDISQIPAASLAGKGHAAADLMPHIDQWGEFISGFAPVIGPGENFIIGIDIILN